MAGAFGFVLIVGAAGMAFLIARDIYLTWRVFQRLREVDRQKAQEMFEWDVSLLEKITTINYFRFAEFTRYPDSVDDVRLRSKIVEYRRNHRVMTIAGLVLMTTLLTLRALD